MTRASLGIRGLSVTIPHKEPVMKWLAKIDGAVPRRGGRQHDLVSRKRRAVGFQHRLPRRDGQPGGRARSPEASRNDFCKGKVGAGAGRGGAARAIAYGLARRGADVILASRTSSGPSPGKVRRLPGGRLGGPPSTIAPDILVNCTRWACIPTSMKLRTRSITSSHRWSCSTRSTTRKARC